MKIKMPENYRKEKETLLPDRRNSFLRSLRGGNICA